MRLILLFIICLLLLGLPYLIWYLYERPYPKWWNSVRVGESFGKYSSDVCSDEKNGIDWGGSFNTMGYCYYKRSQWIRTEYAAMVTLNKDDNNTVEKWEIRKMQYDSLYIFRKLGGVLYNYLADIALDGKMLILGY